MTRRPLRTVAAFMLAPALLASGAGVAQAVSQRSVAHRIERATPLIKQAERSAASRNLDDAIGQWSAAISLLQEDRDEYLYGQLYLVRSKLLSDIAWARLLQERPQDAGEAYRASIETIRDGYFAHQDGLTRHRENTGLLLSLVSLGVHAFAMNSAGASLTTLSPFLQVPHWLDLAPADIRLDGVTVHDGDLARSVWRFPVVPDRGPLRRVGRVTGPGCTGSLVGRRIVMTNRHCVWNDDENRALLPGEMTFTLEKVRYQIALPVVEYYTVDGRNAASPTNFVYDQDWALLVVDVPADQELGFLEVDGTLDASTRAVHDGEVVIGGYSADLNRGVFMTMHYGCSITNVSPSGFLSHDCETYGGSSGSPIFSKEGGRWRVVGLNACGRRGAAGEATRSNCGLSVAHIAPRIAELRERYP